MSDIRFEEMLINNLKEELKELKQQLAEKEKAIENWQTMYESVVQTCHNDKEEIERLNKQLATQENTITNLIEDNRASQEWYKKQLEEKEKELKAKETLNQIFKDNREAKISFAVAELNKLWDCLYRTDDKGYVIRFASMNDRDKFNEVFNNQIKQLKEMK